MYMHSSTTETQKKTHTAIAAGERETRRRERRKEESAERDGAALRPRLSAVKYGSSFVAHPLPYPIFP